MISLSFCGDLRLFNPKGVKLSSEVSNIIDSCEYNVINFEAPIITKESAPISKSGPSLFQSSDSPKWVIDNGWNVVSLANNHILDYGEDSLSLTIQSFSDIRIVGAGNWNESYRAQILTTHDDRKIGIIACSQGEFGVLRNKEEEDRLGCAWICHPEVIKTIIEIKEQVNFVIAFVHAGVEHFPQPLPEWRELYRSFIDLGCTAVIASHPHIIQGWEVYNNRPIIYSLGNFCFQKENRIERDSWNESLCTKLLISDNGDVSFMNIPLFYNMKVGEIQVSRSERLISEINSKNNILNNKQDYYDYIQKYLPLEWDNYINLFVYSGFLLGNSNRDFLSLLKRRVIKKDRDFTHLLNNLQNESHRWAIERIIRLKYGISY